MKRADAFALASQRDHQRYKGNGLYYLVKAKEAFGGDC
jgi:hypothetical protein